MIDINEWQSLNDSIRKPGGTDPLVIYGLGIAEEAGEVAGKIKKFFRGDYTREQTREMVLLELGDVAWYLARIAKQFDITFEEVLIANTAKLESRKERGVLRGSGDLR